MCHSERSEESLPRCERLFGRYRSLRVTRLNKLGQAEYNFHQTQSL